MLQILGVGETLYLIDFSLIKLYYIIFIAPLRTCLYPLAPHSFPIKKSPKMEKFD